MIGFNKLEQSIKREGYTLSFLFGFHEFSSGTLEPALVKSIFACLFGKHHFILFRQECFFIPAIFEGIVFKCFNFYLMFYWICMGNGASDVIFRLVFALRPKRAVVLAPTFAEYEAALRCVDAKIDHYAIDHKDFKYESIEISDVNC